MRSQPAQCSIGPVWCGPMFHRSGPGGGRGGGGAGKRVQPILADAEDGEPVPPLAGQSEAAVPHPRARTGAPRDPSVWSITCVYVPRGARGQGAGRQLVRAAVEYAGQHGASVIEAYPVADASKGSRTQLSSGTVGMFSDAGFTAAAPAAGRRVLMRRLPAGARPSQAGHGQAG